jgi:hypothetical protein
MSALASVAGFADGFGWPRLKWRVVGLLPRPFRFDVQDWLTDRCYEKALRRRSSGKGWYAIKSEWDHESYEIWDARCQFHSEQLMARANRLMVKVPSRAGNENDENWTRSTFNGEWHLTLDGIARTRAIIREEERLQREERKMRAETSRLAIVSIALGSIYPGVQFINFVVESWMS